MIYFFVYLVLSFQLGPKRQKSSFKPGPFLAFRSKAITWGQSLLDFVFSAKFSE